MTWLKIDDAMVEHLKCVNLSPFAWTLWLHGLCYCSRNLTDGHIPHAMLPRLSAITRAEKAAAELVDAGLWHRCEHGWEVHDYLQHQRSAEQVRTERAAAADRKRAERSRRDTTTPTAATNPGPSTQSHRCHTDVTPMSRRDGPVTPTVEVEVEVETDTSLSSVSGERARRTPRTDERPAAAVDDPLEDLVPGNHPPRNNP
jgi:hypothetical protein